MSDTIPQKSDESRETRSRTGKAGYSADDQFAAEVLERGADTMRQATETMVEVARRAMDQGQQAIRMWTGAQSPAAESGYAEGRRAVESTTRVMEAYRDATDRAGQDMEALLLAYSSLARGTQQWQHACLEMVQRTLERLGEKPQELLRCTSPIQVAQLQRDIFIDFTHSLVRANVTLLQLASQIAQQAIRPLQERARVSV